MSVRILERAASMRFAPILSVLLVARLALAISLAILWQVGAMTYPSLIAAPVSTFLRISELLQGGQLVGFIAITTFEAAAGLLVGAGFGLSLPFLIQMSPRLQALIEPYARAAIGIPKLALSPILIMWFGIGLVAKIVLVALMTFFMVFVATFAGINAVGPSLVRTVAVFGASRFEIAREVLWNSAQPYVWTALRAALPWAINAALVGEFLASESGLGYYIHHSYNTADITGVYAGIATVAVLVLAADPVLVALERRLMAWRPIDQDLVLH